MMGFESGLNPIPETDGVPLQHLDWPGLDHFPDVGAGRKGFFVSRKNQAANLVVLIQLLQRLHQLLHEGAIQGIQHLGPVELDNRDGVLAQDQQVFITHEAALLPTLARTSK
jgi:hypothetical protein